MAFSLPPASPYRESHSAKPVQGDDEEYVDYLGRTADHWINNPPPAPTGFELVECSATPRHWPEYSPIDDDLYSGGCSRCIIADQAVVDRFLGGEYDLRTNIAERREIARRWVAMGRSLASLERATGWKSDRYMKIGDAA